MALPPGWNGRVYRLSPKHSITLQAATIPLPRLGDDVTQIARRMKAEDAYLVIDDIGPPPPGLREGVWDLNPKLPLAINGNEIQGPWKGGFPSGTAFAVVISDRALMVRVFFGSHPGEAEIEQANAALATLSVAPSRAPN